MLWSHFLKKLIIPSIKRIIKILIINEEHRNSLDTYLQLCEHGCHIHGDYYITRNDSSSTTNQDVTT